MNELIYEVT